MVEQSSFRDISNNAGAVHARAPSKSASAAHLQIAYLPIEQLRASANNARTHSKKQLKQIANSIQRFGFINPVLVSDDCELIAGHGRVEAARTLGLRQVPTVRLSNLSPADRRAYMIADNRLAQLGRWDTALLATEMQSLFDLQFDDVEVTGFSLDEIAFMLDDPAERKTERSAAELPVHKSDELVVSRAGDLWLLGPHQLLCGDAPSDCDAIVRHWQEYSSQPALLSGSALTFTEVAVSRLTGESTSATQSRGEGCHV